MSIADGATGKQSLERRFLASDSLQTVLDYLTIEGFPHEEYKVLSSWPRRDVSSCTAPNYNCIFGESLNHFLALFTVNKHQHL